MIKAHPTDPMLRAFAADELPLPLAVGLSAHCELCPDCAARLKTFEEELAQQYLASPAEPELDYRDEVATGRRIRRHAGGYSGAAAGRAPVRANI